MPDAPADVAKAAVEEDKEEKKEDENQCLPESAGRKTGRKWGSEQKAESFFNYKLTVTEKNKNENIKNPFFFFLLLFSPTPLL